MLVITEAMAPALGDIRAAGPGDWIYLHRDAVKRSDFPKVWESIGVALVRGARLSVLHGEAKA